MMPSTRPVVALDVDGVLNAGGSPADLGPGWRRHRIEIPEHDVPDSPFVAGFGASGLALTVNVNADLHGRWITRLRQSADVVWATTWEQAANLHLAPLLGIEPLPVGIGVVSQPPDAGVARSHDSATWKAKALADAFHGRPLVWIDDDNRPWRESWSQRDGEPTLVVTCDPHIGLTTDQLDQVKRFVADAITDQIFEQATAGRATRRAQPITEAEIDREMAALDRAERLAKVTEGMHEHIVAQFGRALTDAEILALTRASVKGIVPSDAEMETFPPELVRRIRRAAAERHRRGSWRGDDGTPST